MFNVCEPPKETELTQLSGRRFYRLIVIGLSAVLLAAVGCTAPQATAPVPPIAAPDGKAWNLVFDVEFAGESVDTTKLSECFDWNHGDCTSSFNDGKEHYLPSQVQVRDGVAHLVAEPLNLPLGDSACYQGSCTYKSGLLSTARPDQSSPYLFPFTYGYVESRIKIPATPGMFSAFWMLPTDPSYKYDKEIDILENLGGKPDVIYQTYHYADRQNNYKVNNLSGDNDGTSGLVENVNGKCARLDYSADFHTYGVDWQPDHIAFFIDGTECGRFTATGPGQIPDSPMQIILDLMVDPTWQREAKLVLPSQAATDELEVDYIKVWQAN